MQFNSYLFLLLSLPAVLVGYFELCRMKCHTRARGLLAAISLVFFAYVDPRYLGLLVGSMVFNWAISRVLAEEGNKETVKGNGKTPGRTGGKKSGRPGSRMVLVSGICASLALLLYFKYTNFFIESLNAFLGKDVALTRLLLPVKISFFTFQQTAWPVDSFHMETGDYSFWGHFLFTVYSLEIAMGPILLHGEFIPQLKGLPA